MTWFLWALALLGQQGFQALHTRAKVQRNLWYSGVAGTFSHLTWILSNFFMVSKIVEVKHSGSWQLAVFTVSFYIVFCVIGGLVAQWYAMNHLERKFATSE